MSTKTNFKRISLVAVAALGLGVLTSVAPANALGTVGVPLAIAPSTLYVSTTASTSGTGVPSQTLASATSVGWVTKTSTNGTSASGGLYLTGVAGTGIILPGAQLSLAVGGGTGSGAGTSLVVTGGRLSSVAAAMYDTDRTGAAAATTTSITPAISGDGTTAVAIQTLTSSASMIGLFTASAPAGSTVTIAAYSGTGITGLTTATSGALVGIWSLTVASASASGVVSTADSYIYQQAAVSKGTVAAGTNRYDTSTRMDNGQVGIIEIELNDAYTADITTGTLTATATNNATLKIADASSDTGAEAYAATTSFSTLTPAAANYIYVNQPTVGVAGSTTVTITHNGTVIATKTLNWNGDVASIVVDSANSATIFKNGAADSAAGTNAQAIVYVAKDAAGNAVSLSAAPTVSSASGALVGATLSTTSGTTYAVVQTASLGYGVGTMIVPSSTLNGAGSYKLKVLNSAGTAIYSDVQNVTVSESSLDSFSASWDKTTYAPGEIAVLTITGKDSKGNLIADGYEAAGLSLTVAGSATAGFTSVGTACSTSSTFSGGKFTCKFAANTEGAWSYSVDVTTATAQSASVGALKITSGSAVSNADVLKAIVSLIASINKQIAALQKALLKK